MSNRVHFSLDRDLYSQNYEAELSQSGGIIKNDNQKTNLGVEEEPSFAVFQSLSLEEKLLILALIERLALRFDPSQSGQ
ncbi:hypothetical protein [Telmatospirillum sp.]|uniref:hypothetical protein n=1 Tax=Telmatospirillum sp. TaxID=2079197 RepID=UPI002848A7B8|nr:hypothetical protein [Telmatospirillum sp.]MDR3438978.1 hypothetical protein [Telmatospirillum sp.]